MLKELLTFKMKYDKFYRIYREYDRKWQDARARGEKTVEQAMWQERQIVWRTHYNAGVLRGKKYNEISNLMRNKESSFWNINYTTTRFWQFYEEYEIQMEYYRSIDKYTLELNGEYFIHFSKAVNDWVKMQLAQAQQHIENGKKLLSDIKPNTRVPEATFVEMWKEYVKCKAVRDKTYGALDMGWNTTYQNKKMMEAIDDKRLKVVHGRMEMIIREVTDTLSKEIGAKYAEYQKRYADWRKRNEEAHAELRECPSKFNESPREEQESLIEKCQKTANQKIEQLRQVRDDIQAFYRSEYSTRVAQRGNYYSLRNKARGELATWFGVNYGEVHEFQYTFGNWLYGMVYRWINLARCEDIRPRDWQTKNYEE